MCIQSSLIVASILLFTTTTWALSVARVVDGDTLVLDDTRKVRLIGVDTPELHESQKLEKDSARTGKSREAIQKDGARAAEFTRTLVDGKTITIKYDRKQKDRYGRTLAYVYLKDGTFVNEEMGVSRILCKWRMLMLNQPIPKLDGESV